MRGLAIASLLVILCGLAIACGRTVESGSGARLDPALRRVVTARPDSIVGLLIQSAEPLTATQRAAVVARGVEIGSVVGRIATGRARARDAMQLGELEFILYVELAATIPISDR